MNPRHRQSRARSSRLKRNTPFLRVNQHKIKNDGPKIREHWVGEFEEYLKSLGSIGHCKSLQKNRHGNRVKKCNCLHRLGNDNYPMLRQSVAEFCFDFNEKNHIEKKQQILEWVKMAKVFLPADHHPSSIRFCLPRNYTVGVEADATDGSICKDALLTICGQGLTVWKGICKCLKNNTSISEHGNKGKCNRGLKEGSVEMEYILDHFLFLEGFSEVRVTRFV